jgi:proteasome lid subunit RPN8/RPN11
MPLNLNRRLFMLIITPRLIEAMVAQARKEHPYETCGIIAGVEGSNAPKRLIPLRNIAHSQRFFQFDSKQQLQVWREMAQRGEEPIVIYHSHTDSIAYPSREDILYASEPQAHYVIISTNNAYSDSVRSFRIVNGTVTEERIKYVIEQEATLAMRLEIA